MTTERSEIPQQVASGDERERVIETLESQGNEIAGEGHMGWGNTMHDAADVIRTLQRENEALRAVLTKYGDHTGECKRKWYRSHDCICGLLTALNQPNTAPHGADDRNGEG